MQGEHIIAYGKITEWEGNESGRWIDLEKRQQKESKRKFEAWENEMDRWKGEQEKREGWSEPLRANDIKEVWWIDTRWVLLTSPEPAQAEPAS